MVLVERVCRSIYEDGVCETSKQKNGKGMQFFE